MHIDHYTCTYVHAYECLDAADLCLLQEGCWFHIHIVDKGALSLKLHQNQCMCMDFFFKSMHQSRISFTLMHIIIRNINQLMGLFVDYAGAWFSM